MGIVKKTQFYCLLCDKEWLEDDEPCGCEKAIRYECPVCNRSYDSKFEAEYCCEEREEQTVYQCEECGDIYSDAVECCCDDEGEA